MKPRRKARLRPCSIHTPPIATISTPSSVLTIRITMLKIPRMMFLPLLNRPHEAQGDRYHGFDRLGEAALDPAPRDVDHRAQRAGRRQMRLRAGREQLDQPRRRL